SLAGPGRDDPLRQQFIPDSGELEEDPFALNDPLGEAQYRRAPRLIHQYPDRVLLLAGGSCAGYCRHCFRRVRMSAPGAFIGQGGSGGEELASILAYLKAHGEVREILISGGDPLTAGDGDLDRLFRELRGARPGIPLRLCTRMPITAPERLAPSSIAMLAAHRPLRAAVQINHPRELAPRAKKNLAALAGAGIPILVQTVLLRGVNDRPELLAELFRDCLDLGLRPYYLFQLDLAPGTRRFRVPLKRGLRLYRELAALIPPGPGLPVYAVDLPGGGGKIGLSESSIAGFGERPGGGVWLLRGPGGSLWPYPADGDPKD
ncbi:MAG: radical SAM protein, partial [Treponema sp.]|nr:radical SAM protein [Treponema sp.]